MTINYFNVYKIFIYQRNHKTIIDGYNLPRNDLIPTERESDRDPDSFDQQCTSQLRNQEIDTTKWEMRVSSHRSNFSCKKKMQI